MAPEIQPVGMREAVLAVTPLLPVAGADAAAAVASPHASARQLRLESPATPEPDRTFPPPGSDRPTLPLIVAERARTPLVNFAENHPDRRQRRRKLRMVRRSAWTDRLPELGLTLDISA